MSVVADLLRRHFDGAQPRFVSTVQSLWSGYGAIERWQVADTTVVVKRISPPTAVDHPRGWHSDLSHRRKLRSYQVESHWYRHLVAGAVPSPEGSIAPPCRMPRLLLSQHHGDDHLLVLEDLHAAGFDCAVAAPTASQIRLCLKWLAQLHGHYLHHSTDGLWPQGSYWHLDTRPQEWAQMADRPLQRAAGRIDGRLKAAQYQTLIHGDAKLANFCLAAEEAAALDFQYVGGGSGVRDVAYFLGSCGAETLQQREQWLGYYFSEFAQVLRQRRIDPEPIEHEWRALYDVEQADFARFLNGWAPQHWKVNPCLQAAVARTLTQLAQ
ncbi:phosphotransferase [uncultured Ferrimonas sp.]|uniref:phosphotransferase n=1 Tax=uncultured Ferrimonas sp. TaxID=432640 RepID=UPI002636DA73|nr:phosphotransferase [uncultured Ferrimonas sp.]